jgi:hypothetical protein
MNVIVEFVIAEGSLFDAYDFGKRPVIRSGHFDRQPAALRQ